MFRAEEVCNPYVSSQIHQKLSLAPFTNARKYGKIIKDCRSAAQGTKKAKRGICFGILATTRGLVQ